MMMTEFLIMTSPKAEFSANLQLNIGQEIVLPATSCKSLGVMFDDLMHMDAHISHICRTIHFHLSSHCHPWCHHPRQTVCWPCASRLLGYQAWKAPHCTLQGDWQVRFRLGTSDPSSSWYWNRRCPCPQELAAPHGGYWGLLHLGHWANRHTWKLR